MKHLYRSIVGLCLVLIPLFTLAQGAALPQKTAATKPGTVKPQAVTAKPIIVPEEEAVISAYEKTLPSTVSIIISEQLPNLIGGTSKQDTGGGTGFFVSNDGYIITNRHVVLRNDVDYTVIDSTGNEYVASVLARDPLFDIAIVKVEGSGFIPAKLGDSDKIRIGSTVLAIGNVLAEFRNTVTRGVISGIGRTISASTPDGTTETIENAIQTDASINPGNSGGPLVNLRGEVVGINTAVYRQGEALGFTIPINEAKAALDNYRKNGRIVRNFLGVRYIMLNRALARALGLSYSQGAYVLIKNDTGESGVVPGSPADKAGIKLGDTILEVNGQKLSAVKPLASVLARLTPNQSVKLKILRSGAESTISVTLAERP